MAKSCFYDTSSLLTINPDILIQGHFFMSSISLQELEEIKTNPNKPPDLKYRARRLIRALDGHRDAFTVVFCNDTIHEKCASVYFMPTSNDNLILTCATQTSCDVVYSEDLGMRIIGAEVFDLKMACCACFENDIYTGYKFFCGDEDEFIAYMAQLDHTKWSINEYLIFENSDTGSTSEMRFNGTDFVPLKLPSSSYIKAKNSLQRCALDLLANDDISTVALLGGYGSGKTFLAMQLGLYCVTKRAKQSQILGIREPRGEGKDIGFLPGSFDDKVGRHFEPLAQQMGGTIALENLMRSGTLSTNIPYYMKGTTYNDTIMIVDEAEDLSESQLRLIGTRAGQNTRLFFAGDYNQSLQDRTVTNPLVKMCREFRGNPKFGCIYLEDDVRSETSKMFANLYRTI